MDTVFKTYEISKNDLSFIRIQHYTYKDIELVDIRKYVNKDGDLIPTKQGISIHIEQLPDLLRYLLDIAGDCDIELNLQEFKKAG